MSFAPVLTEDALRFVGAVTFSALASEPARTSLYGADDAIPHTHLGQTADLVVIAPATAAGSVAEIRRWAKAAWPLKGQAMFIADGKGEHLMLGEMDPTAKAMTTPMFTR